MAIRIGRREFIVTLSGAAAWPIAAHAEVDRVRRLALLVPYSESDPEGQARLAALKEELQSLGWAEGRNIRIDNRWGALDASMMQRFAEELIALHPDLILTQSTPTTAAILRQTRTIPVVFVQISDPVGSGFVASLARPGGNSTGFTTFEASLASKWLELLKEIDPRITKVALLYNPVTAPFAEMYLNPFKAAAPAFKVEAVTALVHDTPDLEPAIAALARDSKAGLVGMPDSFLHAHREEITALANQYRVPAIYPFRFYTEVGGLLSYGNDPIDNFRRAAVYVDRILRGTSPSDLPVQVPVKYEMTINLKTAKALGLQVPDKLIAIADEVIE
jgi:putative ABC transport system substrate-binding protein